YLAAHPAKWTTNVDKADADDLYAHFLIDVQTSPCQQTSRIAQAIGSVQRFAQRCLMGLEAGVQTSDPKWQQWKNWMKSFRVWEANPKSGSIRRTGSNLSCATTRARFSRTWKTSCCSQ